MKSDYTHLLRDRMQQVGVSSFKALSRASGVSEKQITRLRQGEMATLRLETLLKLSQALQLPIADFLASFSDAAPPAKPDTGVDDLKREYDRLQQQLSQQRQTLLHEFQQDSVRILESLLLQLPTAAYAAQQKPDAPAVKLLPLLRPLDQLLQHWGIEPIGAVGSEIAYDPQQHQLMDGAAEPGDRVRVRYVGYRQGTALLYRAKVSPV